MLSRKNIYGKVDEMGLINWEGEIEMLERNRKLDFSSFLTKANENLSATQFCFNNNYYNACGNRAYFDIYQAAIAMLAGKGFPPMHEQIGHDWVQATFNRELISRRKYFPRK